MGPVCHRCASRSSGSGAADPDAAPAFADGAVQAEARSLGAAAPGSTKLTARTPLESVTHRPPLNRRKAAPCHQRPPLPPPRHRPGRRLRRAVRPAHRPPRPRGPGLQRDRAEHHAGRGDARQEPGGDHPLRRPLVGVRGGRPAPRPRALRGRRPRLRHVLRLPADGARPSAAPSTTPAPASTAVRALHVSKSGSTLFEGTPDEQSVWMSHGDACSAAPEGFTVTASTDVVPVAAFENDEKKLYGVQYHPEVMHSTHGQQVLEHFLYRGAGPRRRPGPPATSSRSRSPRSASRSATKRAICGLSGGVDSAVAAALVQKAIGSQLTCVYVDHGLMRKGETEQVEKDFVAATGVQLKVVDARGALPRPRWPGSPTPRRSGRSSAASSSGSSSRRRPRSSPRRRRPAGGVPGPGHALPGRGRVRRRHRHRQHQVPPQRGRAARGPRVPADRAAAQALQGRGPDGRPGARACRTRSSSASRSRAPASASASSARSPRSASTCCARPTPSPARS